MHTTAASHPQTSTSNRTLVHREGFDKHILTFPPALSGAECSGHLTGALAEIGGSVVSHMIFGGARESRPSENQSPWPLCHLQGDPCRDEHPFASQAVVVSGTEVRPLDLHGRRVGSVYEDADAVYCHLCGVMPPDSQASRGAQALRFFENIEAALARVGLDFRHTVRTWLYLEHLLDWYDEFNAVRTRFFEERGVFDHLVPASTGIGAANHCGMAITGDVLAIKPKSKLVEVIPVASPLQCPAIDYKSSFSRAIEIRSPGCRELGISGTASIHPDGTSAHNDDIVRQIGLTMDVVAGILTSRGMDWADATRAIAYFKNMNDVEAFHSHCRENGISNLPVALMHADVCRDELLFEIEVDAASTDEFPSN